MSSKNGDKYIKYSLFFATVTLLLGLIGAVFNHTKDLPADMREVKTHIEYIREKFEKQELKDVQGASLPADAVMAKEPTVYNPTITPTYKQPLTSIVEPIHPDESVIKVLESLGLATTTVL